MGQEQDTRQQGGALIDVYDVSAGARRAVEPVVRSDAEWRKALTPEQYRIARRGGTEPAFTGSCATEPDDRSGVYRCVACGTDLFVAGMKFESGTGWPSFTRAVSDLNVRIERDTSHGMQRYAVSCRRCASHMGHVFDDGPGPERERFCINASVLSFAALESPPALPDHALFAGGCFWGIEEAFRSLPGVMTTTVGYAGGTHRFPTYQDVSAERTGHAETVRVEFDPRTISYGQLLDLFWKIHDPTTPNRQGPDIGTQYRSSIFYYNADQRSVAERSRDIAASSGAFSGPIVTEIRPAGFFYPAEEYHQRYIQKRGGASCH